MGSLKVNLCGIELDNPIIPASGTFGFGYEFAELYDINELGTFSFKGTTKEPRFGNPTPRIAECYSGMINAVGLQNPGVEKVIGEELPKLKQCFHKPVMANVSGFAIEDYAYTCERLDKEEQVGWLEVNVSCPNVHGGGMSFGTQPEAAAAVTKAVKIPIIGIGGVSSAEDVIEMMLAGATAVQVGAANLVNPFVCRDIVEKLPEVMQQYNITSLTAIIGGAHK